MHDHEEEEESGRKAATEAWKGWAAGQMPWSSQGLSLGLGRERGLEKRGAGSLKK